MKMFNLTFIEAINFINVKFKLGLGLSSIPPSDIIYPEKKIILKKEPRNRSIDLIERKWIEADKKYWLDQYGISKSNLIEDGVKPLIGYAAYNRNNEYFTKISYSELRYAYTDFKDKRVKIYAPYCNKESKWFTNCNQDDLGSIRFLPDKGDILIISKSYKDCRVIRNLGYNSIWFQNEGMLPSKNLIKSICDRFNRVYVWFDNDSAGIANGIVVTNYLKSLVGNKVFQLYFHTIIKEKDPSDFFKNKGKQELIDFIKNKVK